MRTILPLILVLLTVFTESQVLSQDTPPCEGTPELLAILSSDKPATDTEEYTEALLSHGKYLWQKAKNTEDATIKSQLCHQALAFAALFSRCTKSNPDFIDELPSPFTPAATEDGTQDAEQSLQQSQALLTWLNRQERLLSQVRGRHYHDAVIELYTLRSIINRGETDSDTYLRSQNLYISFVKIIMDAEESLAAGAASTNQYTHLKSVLKAQELLLHYNWHRTGDSYRAVVHDSLLFNDSDELSIEGKEQLDHYRELLKSFPKSTLLIAGHSSRYDARNATKKKAQKILDYISSDDTKDRITHAGMGNKDVFETPAGFLRGDCVEFIFKDIETAE